MEIKYRVNIHGDGYETFIVVPTLKDATKLVTNLSKIKNSEEPLSITDGDNHLIGFVIPNSIRACLISILEEDTPITRAQIELMSANAEMIRVQTELMEQDLGSED